MTPKEREMEEKEIEGKERIIKEIDDIEAELFYQIERLRSIRLYLAGTRKTFLIVGRHDGI